MMDGSGIRLSGRELVGGAAAALTLPGRSVAGNGPEVRPLADIAAANGIRFGTAVSSSWLDGPVGRLAAAECNIYVAENEFKFGSIHPSNGPPQLGPADRIMSWTSTRHKPLRGHNLYWNTVEYTPGWLTEKDLGARPADALAKINTDHIAMMTARYPAVVSWDVINETVDPETGEWRPTVATRLLGDQLLDVAYHAARAGGAHAQLVYNDYMGWNPSDERHRTGVLRTLEVMRRRGVPCDALGLQSHLQVPGGELGTELARRQAIWRGFLKDVTELGFRPVVTELDVDDRETPGDVVRRDRMIGDTVRAYLDVTLSFPDVRDVLVWGLNTKNSWLQDAVPRPDGRAQRGSPFDAKLHPTPMRDAIARAIAQCPARA